MKKRRKEREHNISGPSLRGPISCQSYQVALLTLDSGSRPEIDIAQFESRQMPAKKSTRQLPKGSSPTGTVLRSQPGEFGAKFRLDSDNPAKDATRLGCFLHRSVA
jgi:hypothetical protein